MSKMNFHFSYDTTQRLADARCGIISYNVVRKKPFTIIQTKPPIPNESNDYNKSFDLDEFLKETEGLSYEEIRNGMNESYNICKKR